MRRKLREKIADGVFGVGFTAMLVFASAIDGPGNDLRIVYGGLITSLALMASGLTIGGYWQN